MPIDRYNHAAYVKLTVNSVLGRTLADPISRSWRRCIEQYELDPEHEPNVAIVETRDLQARQSQLLDVLTISKPELTNLYEQIAGSGFAICIACPDGVLLEHIADAEVSADFEKLGMCTGGVWNERTQGTNAIGTCLIDKDPLLVHERDHFLPRNISFTSAAAPIFDHQGEILAVLNASGRSEVAQRHTLALVNTGARTIENRLFLHSFKQATIIRFDTRAEFIGAVREGAIAISQDGTVVGANRNALSQLGYGCHRDLVGKDISDVFDTSHDRLIDSSTKAPGAISSLYSKGGKNRYLASIRLPEVLTATSSSSPRKKRKDVSWRSDSITCEILLDELALGDPRMAMNVRYVRNLRDRDIPILISGETGTGKEVMARAIHSSRDGDRRPFVAVNCAAIPEALIESELFGYSPGAFTGASREGQKGKILQANNGTLFLDEIGDMPLPLQARLLRVLEQREVQPLGSAAATKLDIVLISATNLNLTELVAAGRFRADLYYRLQGLMLSLPPLRERRDKASVIRRMVDLEGQRHLALSDSADRSVSIDEHALQILERYHWPGNIRQLRTVIRVALAICSGSTIRVQDLPDEVTKGSVADTDRVPARVPETTSSDHSRNENHVNDEVMLPQVFGDAEEERAALVQQLEEHRWNIANVARHLHVSRLTVYRRMKRFNISK